MPNVRRIYVEKKSGFDVASRKLAKDLHEILGIKLRRTRIVLRYDVMGLSEEEFALCVRQVFSEPPMDMVYTEAPWSDERVIVYQYLSGQYDQRADNAAQCAQLLLQGERPIVRTATAVVLEGPLSDEEYLQVKKHLINPVDSCEAETALPQTLDAPVEEPGDIQQVEGFIRMKADALGGLHQALGMAMSMEDLRFCQKHFAKLGRDPYESELRVIDTYWSDHCRHTTFSTRFEKIRIAQGAYAKMFRAALDGYFQSREKVYGKIDDTRPLTLMDMATISAKALRKEDKLGDLDESEEINACSIRVKARVGEKTRDMLVMFKNETHNHPTEIEPFGGAATCLGGAIRDPLAGRAYVYQSMRVTGSGNPLSHHTLPNKLPQRSITTGAASGFSSYGNQIGLTTGQVKEYYHEGFVAKRMELGAVVGAVEEKYVRREKPVQGDVVLLIGGRTGRDGCGGATGSSKAHTDQSLESCGAEVQKGNPVIERALQRLFRNPEFVSRVKRCNDFGAGGVCVAIGELSPGLDIDLDLVPKKYEGLNGTELAISESQERMAVVASPSDQDYMIELAARENLEATVVAWVTDTERMVMRWRGKTIVDIPRAFLDTNGVEQTAEAELTMPDDALAPFVAPMPADMHTAWIDLMASLEHCSQQGLVERFDSTIGAGTVIMPFGGKYQATPAQAMAALIPVLGGVSETATVMSHGYDPDVASWSPFHGAVYAIVDAVTKLVASGAEASRVRLTLQEYFEKLGDDPERWGKPLAAMLGACLAQRSLGVAAIGGKDSMSGSFERLNVPPTLVAFGIAACGAENIVTNEFKAPGNLVVLLPSSRDAFHLPNFEELRQNYMIANATIRSGRTVSAIAVGAGGVAAAIAKACFGNRLGFVFNPAFSENLFTPDYGSILLELSPGAVVPGALLVGVVDEDYTIAIKGARIPLDEVKSAYDATLSGVFPSHTPQGGPMPEAPVHRMHSGKRTRHGLARPRAVVAVFPGSNCEYDTERALDKAGAEVQTVIVRNRSAADIADSVERLYKAIANAQMLIIPGGFSGGDEPDGSGKFIAAVLKNAALSQAVMDLLQKRDGLILGICNGFQALVKLGLVPYGEIRELKENSPTLAANAIGRHVSRLVRTRATSTVSPWLLGVEAGDVHTLPVSHGEGRFVAQEAEIMGLFASGQIATQFVDFSGQPSMDIAFNPNGSMMAVEGVTSPDGRILGKMCHSERIGPLLYRNVEGNYDQKIFESGVKYFA